MAKFSPKKVPAQSTEPLKINIDDLETIKCLNCECERFVVNYIIKKIPSVASNTGKEQIINVPLFVCAECSEPTQIMAKAI